VPVGVSEGAPDHEAAIWPVRDGQCHSILDTCYLLACQNSMQVSKALYFILPYRVPLLLGPY
jgi:hypothetical protein